MSLILILVSKRDGFFRPKKFRVPFFMIIDWFLCGCSIQQGLLTHVDQQCKLQSKAGEHTLSCFPDRCTAVHLTPVIWFRLFGTERENGANPAPSPLLSLCLPESTLPTGEASALLLTDIPVQISPAPTCVALVFNLLALMAA